MVIYLGELCSYISFELPCHVTGREGAQSTYLEIIKFVLNMGGTKTLPQHLSLWKIRWFLQY